MWSGWTTCTPSKQAVTTQNQPKQEHPFCNKANFFQKRKKLMEGEAENWKDMTNGATSVDEKQRNFITSQHLVAFRHRFVDSNI